MISGYNSVWRAMGQGPVGLGSDANGMEKLPRATPGPDSAAFYAGLPEQVTGSRVWDYTRDGVAHYGLMRESPRARGTVCGFLREFLCGRFIPAGAGNRLSAPSSHRPASVHPRGARGTVRHVARSGGLFRLRRTTLSRASGWRAMAACQSSRSDRAPPGWPAE